jgi:hypothetical protein
MAEYRTSTCPDCGAANGPGAPACHTCGKALVRAGFAARPVDDDDDEPRRPAKKPGRPAEDAVRKGAPPPKKKPVDEDEDDEPRRPAKRRPVDDDEDDEPRRPSRKRRRDEEEEEPESIRDNAILNMFFPVGVSLWALGSNYLGVFSLLGAFAGFIGGGVIGVKMVGYVICGLAALFGLLAMPLGALAFIMRPKKTTYGGVTGYMRAVIGIICGLLGIIGAGIAIFMLATIRL